MNDFIPNKTNGSKSLRQTAHHRGQIPPKVSRSTDKSTLLLLGTFAMTATAVDSLPGFNHLVVALGIVCMLKYLLLIARGKHAVLPPELKLFLAFVAWAYIGLVTSLDFSVGITRWYTLVQLSLMIAIFVFFCRDIKTTRSMLTFILFGVLIMAGPASYLALTQGSLIEGQRISGYLHNPNALTTSVATGVLILLYFLRTSRSKTQKVVIVSTIMFLAVAVLATGSRRGFVVYLTALASWLFFSYGSDIRRKPLAFVSGLVLIIACIAGFLHLMEGTMMQRRVLTLADIRYGTEDRSTHTRIELIRRGTELFLQYPVKGVGIENLRTDYYLGMPPHNLFVSIFTGTGLVGGILYFGLFVVLIFRLHSLRKNDYNLNTGEFINLMKCFIIIFLATGMAADSFYFKDSMIVISIGVGFSYQLGKNRETMARHVIKKQPYK